MKEVAVGIIRQGSRVLICQRRSAARYPLKWEFPGGKLEIGESAQEALKRELAEELGINAEIGAEFHRQEWLYTDEDASASASFRIYYHIVGLFEGTPRNLAFEQIRWVSPDELQRLDILEGNREAVAIVVHDDKGNKEG